MALRCRIASLAIALMWAAGCSNTGSSSGGENLGNPPLSFTYSVNPAVYVVGFEITPNSPSVNGLVDEFLIDPPSLPDGLMFDTNTGVVSGTPTNVTPEQPFLVTALTSTGGISMTLSIRVDDRPRSDTGQTP